MSLKNYKIQRDSVCACVSVSERELVAMVTDL